MKINYMVEGLPWKGDIYCDSRSVPCCFGKDIPVDNWTRLHKDVGLGFIRRTAPRVGRDSSVGVATRYRLDGPGIESR